MLDSMSDPEASFAAPAATPEVVEVGDDSGAIAPLLSADLVRGEESGMKGQDLTGCGGARRSERDRERKSKRRLRAAAGRRWVCVARVLASR